MGRSVERREEIPLQLLLASLSSLQSLDMDSLGEELAHLIKPVLQTAARQLDEAADQRRVLEAELVRLRVNGEVKAVEVEEQSAWIQREEERVAAWLEETGNRTKELQGEINLLQTELQSTQAHYEALSKEVNEGLEAEHKRWHAEEQHLEEEVADLRASLAKLELELQHEFLDKSAALKAQFKENEQRLKRLQPLAAKQAVLKKRLADREAQVEELQRELSALIQRRLNKQPSAKKTRRSPSRGPRPKSRR